MSDPSSVYLHGFSSEEQQRLLDQAHFIAPLIYPGIHFDTHARILEIGSGVGAQTEILLRMFPNIHITCIDAHGTQLSRAAQYLEHFPHAKGRYELLKQDAQKLDFADNSFDGVFLCWILEHVAHPMQVLKEAYRVLRPGATLFANEVMNSSFFIYPHRESIWTYWQAFNQVQSECGGDPHIGAKLGGFLSEAGFDEIQTIPKALHLDQRNPEGRRKALRYWRDLFLSAREQLQGAKLIPADLTEKVREEFFDLENCTDAVLYYAFMQASAKKS